MSSDLQIFSFGENPVRVLDQGGEPWFVLADVCGALGIANSRDASGRLDDDERADVGITDTSSNGVTQRRQVTIVSEPGVYRIVFTSRADAAERFKRWLAHDVIPSIRRTGRYDAGAVRAERQPDESALVCVQDGDEVAQVKAFAREHCIRTPGAGTPAWKFWTRYEHWRQRMGFHELTMTFIGNLMLSWGCPKTMQGGRKVFMNVGLR